MEKEDYSVSSIYQGGYSTFKPYPSLAPDEETVTAGSLGLTTDPRTANILKEVSTKLSTGVKQIEVEGLDPSVFESIPTQQLKEVNRLSKLTGVDVSLHGPLVEPSGIGQQGFTETSRESAERQMKMAIERAHELNPEGNIPVTFHSSSGLSSAVKPMEKGEMKELEEAYVIDRDSGRTGKIPLKKRQFPGENGETLDVEKEIEKLSEREWNSKITNLSYATDRANAFIRESGYLKFGAEAEEKAGIELVPEEKEAVQSFDFGSNYLKDSYRQLKDLYEEAYKYCPENERQILDDMGANIKAQVDKLNESERDTEKILLMQKIIGAGLKEFKKLSPPRIYEEIEDFAKEKSVRTFANVAWDSYEKFKGDAPIITVENPPVGGMFSTGEELKDLVEKSREKFVEKAVEEGLSKSEAKKQAEKLLGVTWDVGHINMLRKHGYEDKEILEETKKIAPLLKHVHLSDNFGFEHTELPMGMGNVPIKEIMEKLGKKGFEAKKIIEAGNWWQHFQSPPVQETLEAFGSPLYSMNLGPYWNQTQGLQQNYFGGYGMMLPNQNYQMVGAGFAQLPTELGGQLQGAGGSRMSGNQME